MHIKYPSHKIVKEIGSASTSKIIKEIADGHLQSAMNGMVHSETFKTCFEVSLTKIVEQETQHLTSRKQPSILSKTDSESLLTFSDKKFVDEIKEKRHQRYTEYYSKSPHIRTYFFESQAETGSHFKDTMTNIRVKRFSFEGWLV